MSHFSGLVVLTVYCEHFECFGTYFIEVFYLTLKAPYKAADDILIFYFYLSKKIRLDFFM